MEDGTWNSSARSLQGTAAASGDGPAAAGIQASINQVFLELERSRLESVSAEAELEDLRSQEALWVAGSAPAHMRDALRANISIAKSDTEGHVARLAKAVQESRELLRQIQDAQRERSTADQQYRQISADIAQITSLRADVALTTAYLESEQRALREGVAHIHQHAASLGAAAELLSTDADALSRGVKHKSVVVSGKDWSGASSSDDADGSGMCTATRRRAKARSKRRDRISMAELRTLHAHLQALLAGSPAEAQAILAEAESSSGDDEGPGVDDDGQAAHPSGPLWASLAAAVLPADASSAPATAKSTRAVKPEAGNASSQDLHEAVDRWVALMAERGDASSSELRRAVECLPKEVRAWLTRQIAAGGMAVSEAAALATAVGVDSALRQEAAERAWVLHALARECQDIAAMCGEAGVARSIASALGVEVPWEAADFESSAPLQQAALEFAQAARATNARIAVPAEPASSPH